MANFELDARHLLCPMPVIKTQNKSRELNHGDILTIKATDPGALHDLPSWTRINGHHVISCQLIENEVHVVIELVKER